MDKKNLSTKKLKIAITGEEYIKKNPILKAIIWQYYTRISCCLILDSVWYLIAHSTSNYHPPVPETNIKGGPNTGGWTVGC